MLMGFRKIEVIDFMEVCQGLLQFLYTVCHSVSGAVEVLRGYSTGQCWVDWNKDRWFCDNEREPAQTGGLGWC